MAETVKEIEEGKRTGTPKPSHSDGNEIGGYIFDFLFIAQYASKLSLLYMEKWWGMPFKDPTSTKSNWFW